MKDHHHPRTHLDHNEDQHRHQVVGGGRPARRHLKQIHDAGDAAHHTLDFLARRLVCRDVGNLLLGERPRRLHAVLVRYAQQRMCRCDQAGELVDVDAQNSVRRATTYTFMIIIGNRTETKFTYSSRDTSASSFGNITCRYSFCSRARSIHERASRRCHAVMPCSTP